VSVVELVREHIAAFNAHDTSRLLAGLAPDAVWITGQDTVSGQDALGEMFDDGLWSLAPQLEPLSVLVDGDRAALQLRETITRDGARCEFVIAVFLDFAAGLIARAKVYREGSADL
jgi:ketosteroid isomerase-like protein